MSDESWANASLRQALQAVKDEATKPLHVEIERLCAKVERLTEESARHANACLESEQEVKRLRSHLSPEMNERIDDYWREVRP
jgi:hypothetical protein